MKELILLIGAPGAGKSTYAEKFLSTHFIINQDSQGKDGHWNMFLPLLSNGNNIVIDRMGFSVEQRKRYIEPAKKLGYKIRAIVFHTPESICKQRCYDRQNHPTIQDEVTANKAIHFFFSKYEKPNKELEQIDDLEFIEYQFETPKVNAIWCDLDGTLCDIEHRRVHVEGAVRKNQNWGKFFAEMVNDTPNYPVLETLNKFSNTHQVVYCSGRPDDYNRQTKDWLNKYEAPFGALFMRRRNDFRKDNIVKEIMLDFEVKPRYNITFCLDDRDQVVEMLRGRGETVFQVAKGSF